MKNKKLLVIVLSITALIALLIATLFVFVDYKPKGVGTITIEVVELDGSIKCKKDIKFKENDSLIYLIESNFENVVFENGMITSIMDYITPFDWSTFLSIYINNEMSNVGISDIKFMDKDIISIRITEFIYDY